MSQQKITDQDIKYFLQKQDDLQQILKKLKKKYITIEKNLLQILRKIKYVESFLKKNNKYKISKPIQLIQQIRNKALINYNQSVYRKLNKQVIQENEKILANFNYYLMYRYKEIELEELIEKKNELLYEKIILKDEILKFDEI